MASRLGRYTVSSPATSQLFRNALQAAINEGSRAIELTLSDIDSHQTLEITFKLQQTRYRAMSTEYLGELPDHSRATIIAMTHPDLSDTPASLTLVRRATP